MTKRFLIVCSGNAGRISPFIREQVDAIVRLGINCDYFLIEGRGITGYIRSLIRLRKIIRNSKPFLIHAHYGLAGLLANLQRKVPVITTFHGSDINEPVNRPFSILATRLSARNVFISQQLADKAGVKKDYDVIPCGIDLSVFHPVAKSEARINMNLPEDQSVILFAGSFTDTVKNYPLAKQSVELIPGALLLELSGYTRQEVNLLMNASDAALMTSFNEGSPQFIKEAMACNTPIVSVNVGDVADRVAGIEGCYITGRDPQEIANALTEALAFGKKTQARERILELDNKNIAKKIAEIYESL